MNANGLDQQHILEYRNRRIRWLKRKTLKGQMQRAADSEFKKLEADKHD